MRASLLPAICLPVVLAGCTDNTAYIIVTVDGRAAVHDVATLHVTLTNNGSDRSDDLVFTGKTFPATFSISAPGRTGELDLAIDALDGNGIAVGHGTAQSTLAMTTADVLLDSTDFVINTDFAGNQYLSSDFEANGNQLATISNGTWTAAFRDDCLSPCNMFARRFDSAGVPVTSELAAGTQAFPLTTTLTTASSTPAIAASGTTTLAFWDFDDQSVTPAVQGVACRPIDENGNSSTDQVTVASDALSDVVSATPLSNGNFALTWNASLTNESVRGAVVMPDCSPVGLPVTVSTSTTTFSHRAAIAASGGNIMYAWIDDTTGVHTRMASNANVLTSVDTVVIAPRASEAVQHVRLTSFGNGFALVVRWAPMSGTGDGRIELYQATASGTISGSPLVVTSKSGGDFMSVQSFGVTTAADGSVMVVWSACGTNGDGSGCGVFGQLVSASQTLSGGPISLATTTTGDQTNPSVTAITGGFVAGWADTSGAEPDHAGSAARARIIYP